MNNSGQATTSSTPHPVLDEIVSTTRYWWLLLITGVAWIVIAIVILRFNYATVAAIAALFGVFCFVAAANEVMVGAVSSKWWRILHWLLAVLFHRRRILRVLSTRRHVRRVGRGDELLFRLPGSVSTSLWHSRAAGHRDGGCCCSSVSLSSRSGSGLRARGRSRSSSWCRGLPPGRCCTASGRSRPRSSSAGSAAASKQSDRPDSA